MSTSVEQIKERLSIEDVIGSYIKLERAGNSLKAKCPFHNEKTPSFFVSPDRGGYYCFGCGVKGDIFTFVQEFEGIDFVGALKILADRAGVQLEKISPKVADKKERLYYLLEVATEFLEKNLQSEEIPLDYLKKRGLTEKTIKDWRIGYVRNEWRTIYEHLKSKGFLDEEMERAGMIKTEGQNTYDRFRGRIMFPLFDSAGRVIAFSGRIMPAFDDGKAGKYLNSPQTEIFDKSKTLYGFDRAKLSIRKLDFSVLVEGQMDLIMSHQAGFTNVVASSGTALTAEHLKLLKRISNRIIMSFDSDNAGAKAAERGWALALASGMEVKVAAIPKGFDPADLILKSKEEFKDVLKNAVHIIDFLLERVYQENTDERKIGIAIKNKALPYLSLIDSNIEKSHYVSKISSRTGIKEEAIWDDLKKVKLDEDYLTKVEEKVVERPVDVLPKGSAERSLASIIALEDSRKDKVLNSSLVREKIKNILKADEYKLFDENIKKIGSELAFEAESYYGDLDEVKFNKELDYILLNLQEEIFKKELADLMSELKKAENAKESEKAISILQRCNEISKKLHQIKTIRNKIKL